MDVLLVDRDLVLRLNLKTTVFVTISLSLAPSGSRPHIFFTSGQQEERVEQCTQVYLIYTGLLETLAQDTQVIGAGGKE